MSLLFKKIFFFFFRQDIYLFFYILVLVKNMKVKVFDAEDEKDLESDINNFLEDFEGEVIDIKYQVGVSIFSEEQVFCFSAMVVYY